MGGASRGFALAALVGVVACAAPPRAPSPTSAATAAAVAEDWRALPPAPEPLVPLRMPEPYVATLPNGMRLVVLERHSLRLVAAELVVRGGMAGMATETAAALHVMAAAITAGTRQHSETQFYQALNQNLLQLYAHTTDSWFGITLRAPASRFEEGLAILREVALEPIFAPYAIDVTRRRLIGKEAVHGDQPALTVRRNMFAALYGPRHPYTVALAPQAHDLEGLVRNDVARTWREAMDPLESTLVVVGDVDPVVVRQWTDTLFGGWTHDRASPAAAPVPAPPPPEGSVRIIAVDRPGARQATLAYGGRLPDDSPAQSAAGALIRELVAQAEGRARDSAGAGRPGASWSSWRHFPAAAFWWEKTVAPDQAGAALTEIESWLGRLRERGPGADDLEAARRRVARTLPVSFETIEATADLYGDVIGTNAPLDWFEQFHTSAAGLRWDRIRGALPPSNQMRVVVVGDLAAVLDQLLSLGWGPVEVHDADGRLLRTVAR